MILGIIVMAIAVIAFIVLMERAQRRLLIQYPKRQVATRCSRRKLAHAAEAEHERASSRRSLRPRCCCLPITVANFSRGQGPDWLNTLTAMLGHGQPLFLVLYAALIIFFAFFYTSIMFNPKETAENLKKYGGFIPGIRPGERTAEYIDYVLTRITLIVRFT